RFKTLLTEVLLELTRESANNVRHGAIIDHRHGQAALDAIVASELPLWTAAPIEMPVSRPLEFDLRFGAAHAIASWPRDRIIKCLAFYHPDDADELRAQQEQK